MRTKLHNRLQVIVYKIPRMVRNLVHVLVIVIFNEQVATEKVVGMRLVCGR